MYLLRTNPFFRPLLCTAYEDIKCPVFRSSESRTADVVEVNLFFIASGFSEKLPTSIILYLT